MAYLIYRLVLMEELTRSDGDANLKEVTYGKLGEKDYTDIHTYNGRIGFYQQQISELLTTTQNYTANALAAIGTSQARKALEEARFDKNTNKKNYAVNALRNLMQRSPGYQYISMGRHYSQQLDWKQALTQYNLAVKIDPRLSAAYAGRGNARLQLKDQALADARKDFLRAVELDPFNSQAMTGMAILLLREGKLDAGLKYAEDSQKQAASATTSVRRMYAYNLACVYSRAIEMISKDDTIADRTNRLADCRKKALEQLQRAVKYGWSDKAWLNKDPDLKAVRAFSEFQPIFGTPMPKPTTKPTKKPTKKPGDSPAATAKPKIQAKPAKPAARPAAKPKIQVKSIKRKKG